MDLLGLITNIKKAIKYSSLSSSHKIKNLFNGKGLYLIKKEKYVNKLESLYCKKGYKQYISIINPDDISFYSPENMVEEIKAFCDRTGQPVPQTKGEIARCVFDSMALAYKKMLSDIESICDKQFGDIHIIGGGCQNVLVNQIAADVTGRKVVAGPIEATAIGNILVQLITLGEIADISAGRKIVGESFDAVEYYPEKDAPDCTAAYDKFLSLM
jgi:rhamnulokinase